MQRERRRRSSRKGERTYKLVPKAIESPSPIRDGTASSIPLPPPPPLLQNQNLELVVFLFLSICRESFVSSSSSSLQRPFYQLDEDEV